MCRGSVHVMASCIPHELLVATELRAARARCQEPSNKRNIIVDAKLATLFTPPINMFSMNKQLSKHVFTKKGAEHTTCAGCDCCACACANTHAPRLRTPVARSCL